MTSIIKPNTCQTCAHSFKDDQGRVCRRNPPVGHPVIQMTPQGPNLVAIVSIFPKVEASMSCGEFSGVATRLPM